MLFTKIIALKTSVKSVTIAFTVNYMHTSSSVKFNET